MWVDAHNHLQHARLGPPAPLLDTLRSAGINRCVVNATCEEDWQQVLRLATLAPDLIRPAFGIHPWNAHTATPGWQDRLRELLLSHPVASIGECGLDLWVDTPALGVQLPIFLAHLRLARELDRPLTLHCLKAWNPLFESFSEEPPPPRILLHSFGGSIEIARRLLHHGAHFSFSGYFLHPRKSRVLEVFRQIPLDRILLETDCPDMLPPPAFIEFPLPSSANHPANLPAIGRGLAHALGIPSAELAAITSANALRFFNS